MPVGLSVSFIKPIQKYSFGASALGFAVALCLAFIAPAALKQSFCLAQDPALRPALKSAPNSSQISANRVRKDPATARKLAAYRWFDQMALADPTLVEAVASYNSSAKILARHPHIDKIAEADHYLCRRLTKWPQAARLLVANPKCYKVVMRDPEGIYLAIKNDRSIAKKLSRNPYFDQMVVENPDLGKMLARYM